VGHQDGEESSGSAGRGHHSCLVVSAQSGATRLNEARVIGEVFAPHRFRLGDEKEAAGGADPMDAGTYYGTAGEDVLI
jgi:hypothetical protein